MNNINPIQNPIKIQNQNQNSPIDNNTPKNNQQGIINQLNTRVNNLEVFII
jgi:hypothetical protein